MGGVDGGTFGRRGWRGWGLGRSVVRSPSPANDSLAYFVTSAAIGGVFVLHILQFSILNKFKFILNKLCKQTKPKTITTHMTDKVIIKWSALLTSYKYCIGAYTVFASYNFLTLTIDIGS